MGDQVLARWPNSAFASLVAAIPGCTFTKIEEGRAIRVADEEGGPHLSRAGIDGRRPHTAPAM